MYVVTHLIPHFTSFVKRFRVRECPLFTSLYACEKEESNTMKVLDSLSFLGYYAYYITLVRHGL